jgi:hypothetical protein
LDPHDKRTWLLLSYCWWVTLRCCHPPVVGCAVIVDEHGRQAPEDVGALWQPMAPQLRLQLLTALLLVLLEVVSLCVQANIMDVHQEGSWTCHR